MSATYTCAECDPAENVFATSDDLEAHIASDHLNMFPYECDKCKYAKFPTEFTLASHYHTDHNIADFYIKYRYYAGLPTKRAELKEKMRVSIEQSSHPVSSTVNPPPPPLVFDNGGNLNLFGAGAFVPKMELHSTSMLGTDYYEGFLGGVLSRHETEGTSHDIIGLDRDGGGTRRRARELASHRSTQKIQCALCPDVVSKQRSSMVYHANTRHGKYELYECSMCHRKWQTIARSDVVKHLKSHHNIAPSEVEDHMVIDFRKDLGNKLNEITDKCFPERKKRRIGYRDVQQS